MRSPVENRKHPLYRCSGRTYLGNRLSPSGLSIRKIAAATGLSSSRIHQLLSATEAKEIPVWLSQLRQSSGGSGRKKKAKRPEPETEIRSRFAREVEVLRRCAEWLQRLERGENVVVNLRPDEDVEAEFVAFDRPRVVRVLERIAADLDNLSLAWCRMARTRTKNRPTMILEQVIAMSWPSRHGRSRKS
jgi:hypothetical protein